MRKLIPILLVAALQVQTYISQPPDAGGPMAVYRVTTTSTPVDVNGAQVTIYTTKAERFDQASLKWVQLSIGYETERGQAIFWHGRRAEDLMK